MTDDTALTMATQPLSFALFLDKMKQPAAQDLVRATKGCEFSHREQFLRAQQEHLKFSSLLPA